MCSWILQWSRRDKVRLLVQKHRLVSAGWCTPSHKPSYHSSCRPRLALLYGRRSQHHTHLERKRALKIQDSRFVIASQISLATLAGAIMVDKTIGSAQKKPESEPEWQLLLKCVKANYIDNVFLTDWCFFLPSSGLTLFNAALSYSWVSLQANLRRCLLTSCQTHKYKMGVQYTPNMYTNSFSYLPHCPWVLLRKCSMARLTTRVEEGLRET